MKLYNLIKDMVENELISNCSIDKGSIVYADEIPDDSLDLFVRIFWKYGSSNYVFNNKNTFLDDLNIEIYEKKYSASNKSEDIAIYMRDLFANPMIVSDGEGGCAYTVKTSISENSNEPQWRSFNINVNIQIFKETQHGSRR